MPESRTPAAALSDGLSNRQVTMISIAGIIGAGLFIGSANAIATTGPAILFSYAITGLLVLLVMRMLGEMAVLNPDSGSFSTYATEALGQRAGFTVGWLYWWFWVLLIPVEAIAGADILHAWFSAVPSWAFTAAIIAALTATNLLQVKNFGEFEFWFSLVKVLAIVAFIAVGALAVFGAWPLADVSGQAPPVRQPGLYATRLWRGADRHSGDHVLLLRRGNCHHRRRRVEKAGGEDPPGD